MTPVVVRTRAELAAAREELTGPVVLVPTMGALHMGHRALLRRARELAGETGCVVVSIFVNPLQFGPGEDLDKYPRMLEQDLSTCRDEGVAVVFAPEPSDIYPQAPVVTVDPGPAGQVLEGEFRPGHFRGVLTVVIKLLGLVRPGIAVFGEKDRQQLALIRRMVSDLDIGVEIAAVPTVREPDGLAVSSRNRYLSPAERATALSLSRALAAAEGEASAGQAKAVAAARLVLDDAAHTEPPLRVDYLALAHPVSFAPLGDDYEGRAILAVAARVGSTRLIDNTELAIPGSARGRAPARADAGPETGAGPAAGPAAASLAAANSEPGARA
ncbi:MAG: pantoate--beta-alanine ligase [Micromonosporaceae bacterium]